MLLISDHIPLLHPSEAVTQNFDSSASSQGGGHTERDFYRGERMLSPNGRPKSPFQRRSECCHKTFQCNRGAILFFCQSQVDQQDLQPTRACFGQKGIQRELLLRRHCRDLLVHPEPANIHVVPTARDPATGLVLSSRRA